jgi:hypothetical protein
MQQVAIRATSVSATALAFWQLATMVLGVQEPWDSPEYPAFYIASHGLCGVFGYLWPSRPWRWALLVIFAQLPVMVLQAGRVDPLLSAGLGLLTLQALPAILVAIVASRFRNSKRPG